jgi:hypothetical protein
MGVSMLQNQAILGIENPIKSYARAAERRWLLRFRRLLSKNYCVPSVSANRDI